MLNTDRLCMGCMNETNGEQKCPYCGHPIDEQNPRNTLPTRFWLHDRYMVGRVLEADGEGITYLGWDNADDIAVSIREYFPMGIALRNPDRTVSMMPEKKYSFNEGLLDFLTLNRKLEELTLPALTKGFASFEENGTAYAIRSATVGKTLEEFLTRNGGSLKWEQARPLFLPLLDTLLELHAAGIVHGGISPESIIVERDGKLKLTHLSLLKIRESGSDFQSSLIPGYAAPEQYTAQTDPTETSDVYALSAVLFRVLIGTVPPAANERVRKESLTVPAHFANELPRQVLVSLANGLQLQIAKRTQNIEIFRNELVYGETAEARHTTRSSAAKHSAAPAAKSASKRKSASTRTSASTRNERTAAEEPRSKKGGKRRKGVVTVLISAVITALLCAGLLFFANQKLHFIGKTDDDTVTSSQEDTSSQKKTGPKSTVPDLCGDDINIYYADVDEMPECKPFNIVFKYESNKKIPAGIIFAQSAKAGEKLVKGSDLTLTVSLGPEKVRVPNIKNLSERDAWEKLLDAGLQNIVVMDRNDYNKPGDVVVYQTIEPGSMISPYEEFRFDVNKVRDIEEEERQREEEKAQREAAKENN